MSVEILRAVAAEARRRPELVQPAPGGLCWVALHAGEALAIRPRRWQELRRLWPRLPLEQPGPDEVLVVHFDPDTGVHLALVPRVV